MSKHGELVKTYTPSFAIRHQIEIWHDELNRYQLISSDDPAVTTQRAVANMAQWDEMWARKVAAETDRLQRESRARGIEDKTTLAAELTRAAQASLRKLETVLHDALERGRSFSWESLKDHGEFPEPKPDMYRMPAPPSKLERLRSPPPSGTKYRPRLNILDRISTSRKCAKLEAAAALLVEDQKKW